MPWSDNQSGLGDWPFFAMEEPEMYMDSLLAHSDAPDRLLHLDQSRDGLRSTRAQQRSGCQCTSRLYTQVGDG